MRKVKYNGKPTHLGRHGKVSTGDFVLLYEYEWDGLLDDNDFSLVEEINEPETPLSVPMGTDMYDLRSITWNSGNLYRLLNKYNSSRLVRIQEAMRFCGIDIPAMDHKTPRDTLIDSIHRAAIDQGWVKLREEDLLRSGVQKRKVRVRNAKLC